MHLSLWWHCYALISFKGELTVRKCEAFAGTGQVPKCAMVLLILYAVWTGLVNILGEQLIGYTANNIPPCMELVLAPQAYSQPVVAFVGLDWRSMTCHHLIRLHIVLYIRLCVLFKVSLQLYWSNMPTVITVTSQSHAYINPPISSSKIRTCFVE